MAYSDFSLEQVIEEFSLTHTVGALFPDVQAIDPGLSFLLPPFPHASYPNP